MLKKRLDQVLVEQGLAKNLLEADRFILAGEIELQPSIHPLKAGSLIPPNSKIFHHPLPRFVSRGGEKLEAALEHWKINVKDRTGLDIGCSTGGFTDCLLQRGAKLVYAVDVGYGQIHPKLRNDPRVLLYEKTHILRWSPPWLTCPDLVTLDLSFISLKSVLPKLKSFFPQGRAEFLILIKPQFEAEKKWLRKGIVTNEEKIQEITKDIIRWANGLGFKECETFLCPVIGTKGNREVWLRMRIENSGAA